MDVLAEGLKHLEVGHQIRRLVVVVQVPGDRRIQPSQHLREELLLLANPGSTIILHLVRRQVDVDVHACLKSPTR